MQITRRVTVLEYTADELVGITINGVVITWDEWFAMTAAVMVNQPKQRIQLHTGQIIPGDWINGEPAKPEDFGREINTFETITMAIIPEYRQVTSGHAKFGDLYWSQSTQKWDKIDNRLVDAAWVNFYRLMRKV